MNTGIRWKAVRGRNAESRKGVAAPVVPARPEPSIFRREHDGENANRLARITRVLAADTERSSLSGCTPAWAMIPYLLVGDILNTAISAFLIFADRIIYPFYEAVEGRAGALRDQAAAGAIMWVPGSIIYLVPAIVIAARLFSSSGCLEQNRRADRGDHLGAAGGVPILRR